MIAGGGALGPWRSAAWVYGITVAVFAIHWRTAGSMIEQWQRSQTYSHGAIVLPIFAWLVWSQRRALQAVAVRPWWPALVALLGLALLWLVGEALASTTPSQLAMVAMVPAGIAALLGLGGLRVLAFPLAFLFFAIPVGDGLVPVLIDWTADFAVAALRLSGIPVFRDGTNFSTPGGDWSVVDSCSGIRYVFACLMVSSLYAWLMYRSWWRRALFLVVALAVAIAANWLRAYAIVVLAHVTDNRIAVGVDHLIYGGAFLAVILSATMWAGLAWRERASPASARSPQNEDPLAAVAGPRETASPAHRMAAALAVALLVCALPVALQALPDRRATSPGSVRPLQPHAGWSAAGDEPIGRWRPQWHNPSAVRVQTFAKEGALVTVQIALYDRPRPDSKLFSSSNRLVPADDATWFLTQRGSSTFRAAGGDDIVVSTGTVSGPYGRVAVWHWYQIDDQRTTSAAQVALRQLLARLAGRGETGGWILLSTEARAAADADRILRTFADEMRGALESAMQP